MKFLIVALCFVAVAFGEAPRFRSSRLRSQFARQELEATPTEPAAPAEDAPYPAAGGPYPASGWKPMGQAFELPTARAAEPDNAYGTPVEVYGPPDDKYGPPTTPPPADFTTPGDELATEPQAEGVDTTSTDQSGRLRQRSQRLTAGNQGSFFILLPDSTVQRVSVGGSGARVNGRFPARLLQEVRPRFNRF